MNLVKIKMKKPHQDEKVVRKHLPLELLDSAAMNIAWYMYTYNWFTLPYSRNKHNIANQLHSNKNFKKIKCLE